MKWNEMKWNPRLGFEPRPTGHEPIMLPLHNPGWIYSFIAYHIFMHVVHLYISDQYHGKVSLRNPYMGPKGPDPGISDPYMDH